MWKNIRHFQCGLRLLYPAVLLFLAFLFYTFAKSPFSSGNLLSMWRPLTSSRGCRFKANTSRYCYLSFCDDVNKCMDAAFTWCPYACTSSVVSKLYKKQSRVSNMIRWPMSEEVAHHFSIFELYLFLKHKCFKNVSFNVCHVWSHFCRTTHNSRNFPQRMNYSPCALGVIDTLSGCFVRGYRVAHCCKLPWKEEKGQVHIKTVHLPDQCKCLKVQNSHVWTEFMLALS